MAAFFSCLVFLACLCSSSAPAGAAAPPPAVLPLAFDTFFGALEARAGGALVLFYAPWCPKSRGMYPAFSRAATR